MVLRRGTGKGTHAKGARLERAIVSMLTSVGLEAARVPRSGAAGGIFSGDVTFAFPEGSVRGLAGDLRIEAKCRRTGFETIYGWLRDHFAVISKKDGQEAFITLKLKHAALVVEALLRARARIEELEGEHNGRGTNTGHNL